MTKNKKYRVWDTEMTEEELNDYATAMKKPRPALKYREPIFGAEVTVPSTPWEPNAEAWEVIARLPYWVREFEKFKNVIKVMEEAEKKNPRGLPF